MLNPITREIISGALDAVIEEMELLMERTSMSPFIKEKKDFFIGLYDRQGRIVRAHLSYNGPGMVECVLRQYPAETMQPGDVYWFNDPYLSNGAVQHHQDMSFIRPVFFDGKLLAFSVCFGHFWDIGGARPGSISPSATEVFQEGILVPPVRIVQAGQLNEALYRTFLRNSRLPDYLEGDTRAMMATTALGESRLLEIFQRFGTETVENAFDEMIESTRSRVQALTRKIVSQRQYTFTDYMDSDGLADNAIPVVVKMAREGDKIVLDLTESGDQAQGPLNFIASPGVVGCIFGRYWMSIDPTLEVNEGLLLPVELKTREGSIMSPRFPGAVGMRTHARFRLVSGLFGCLGQSNDGNVPAHTPVYVLYYLRGYDKATGRVILCIEGVGVGLGARPHSDGPDAIYFIAQDNYPVEYMEGEFPVRVEQYAINPDSGGAGKFRGGCGVVRDVRVLADCALGTRMDNTRFPPWGVKGGQAGRTGYWVVNPGTANERRIKPIGDGFELKKGDLLRMATNGGGGWGDPFDRDPQRVLRDVLGGFVSLESARRDYGVALDLDARKVDESATRALRSKRKDHALFDRGRVLDEGVRVAAD
jgi:N-methylhydantoinase B